MRFIIVLSIYNNIVKEIDEKDLESERATARLKVFLSIDGPNMFQVMLFEPTPLILKSKEIECAEHIHIL